MIVSLPVKTLLKQDLCSHPRDQLLSMVLEQFKLM